MTPAQASGLVHAPLADWARSCPDRPAITEGAQTISFADLHAAVLRRAQALGAQAAPARVLVDGTQSLTERLVDFLGIVASGRCAAVADPDWPAAVRTAVQASLLAAPSTLPPPQPASAFYVGFTSGSTGLPKGFERHHRSWVESFRICLQTFGPDAGSTILAPGRDAHSLFLFGMLLGLWTGAGVVVQERFSASAALETLRQGHAPCLVSTPSQLILMLELAAHRRLAPMEAVRLILISGARWMRQRTEALRALFPQARIVEFYGASETSFIAWMDSHADVPAAVVGQPFANVQLQIRDATAPDGVGLIYVRSPMLFMGYVGEASDGTAALRDGEWLSVRDLGRLDAQGRLCLAGRENRMVVTQGKNLFAEELEAVLERHPALAAASVHGLDDARRGAQVVAIIRWAEAGAEGAARPDALQLKAWCRQHLEAFKAPRRIWVCADWPHTASGKTDHSRLADRLQALQGVHHADDKATAPCLIPLP